MFKGFKSFSATFNGSALLLGPNNAGKTTLISAIRLCNEAARFTTRNGPSEYFSTGEKTVNGYYLGKIRTDSFNLENIRHEFIEGSESRLELRYHSGATIKIVWPVDDPPFFWLEHKGSHVQTAAAAKKLVPVIGIVPTLTPLERNEKTLSKTHLKSHIETRLSSRHFRNHLTLSKTSNSVEYDELIDFLLKNTPEITGLVLTSRTTDGDTWLDAYYMDGTSRTEKEIFWAGDGIQIWLQLLFHLWRAKDCSTILLDEPDVFLHPDLQRRLVRVVEATNQQIVMSSHAAEVASEAVPSSLLWVERSASNAVRISPENGLGLIADGLGSSFNLSMARALKSKNALFLEGNDMKILRVIAERLDFNAFSMEKNLAIIPIGGFTRWPSVESFGWLSSKYMGSAVNIRLILDRDYRQDAECSDLEKELLAANVKAHIWKKKELESYLISLDIIHEYTGLEKAVVRAELDFLTESFREDVFGQYTTHASPALDSRLDESTKISTLLRSFTSKWEDSLEQRMSMVPPKDLITMWNRRTQETKFPVLTARNLASVITFDNLDWEMIQLLKDIESELTS